MASPNDLLDIPAIWTADPLEGFRAFVQSEEFVELGKHGQARKAQGRPIKPLGRASATVYTHMFSNFLRWLQLRRLRLHEVDAAEIRRFLDAGHGNKDTEQKKLNSLIRIRYLRLLERVFLHLGSARENNPATHAAFGMHRTTATGRDKSKVFLTEKEQIAFLSQLPQIDPFDPDKPDAASWKKRRDRAMLAVMLGAGIRVSEAMHLRTDQIGKKESNGDVPIRFPTFAKGAAKAHDTVLRAFAAPYVLPWVEERELRKIPGALLFPASLKSDQALNKATMYRHVKAALETAGLDVEHRGGRTLRNSFAVRELDKGAPLDQVGAYLGLYERRSVEKYVIEKHKMQPIKE